MGLFDPLSISASGMTAERARMDVVAENLANVNSTRGADGTPYRRKQVILRESGSSFGSALASAQARTASSGPKGVEVAGVVSDPNPPKRVYQPDSPDADADGYVSLPNVNPVSEMVDLISSSRAYEANATAMQTAKQMFTKSLDVLR